MLYTAPSEAPDHYHKWIGLGVIAATLQRKVWFDFAHGKIYPNLYIILVSPPGKAKKSSALSFGENILKEVPGITLGEGATTIEQLVDEIRACESYHLKSDGSAICQSSMTMFSDELGVLLQNADPKKMITILTSWFDCRDKWSYKTKNKGKVEITGVSFNLFAGTTPGWIAEFLPSISTGGGFTTRVLFVYADDVRFRSAYPKFTIEQRELRQKLIDELGIISSLVGECEETPEAHKFMEDWYTKAVPPIIMDKKFADYYNRKQTHMFKLGLCLAVARTGKLVIDIQHYKEALDMLDKAEPGIIKAFGGTGRSTQAMLVSDLITFIEQKGMVDRITLLKMHIRDATVLELDAALGALQEMKYLDMSNNGGKVVYKWIGK